jgi:hypothetical protein
MAGFRDGMIRLGLLSSRVARRTMIQVCCQFGDDADIGCLNLLRESLLGVTTGRK